MITTSTILVSPAQAKLWLGSNVRNRSIRDRQVKQFADDMRTGKWLETHQGIAFYNDGTLADGQHRLAAIVESNVPVKLLVTTGLPVESAHCIDQNRPRMAHDAIHISGQAEWINKNIVALVRFLLAKMGSNPTAFSVTQILDYANRHKNLLMLVDEITSCKKRYYTHSGICASYFCALAAGVPEEKIRRFASIMLNGEIAGQHENAVIRLREFLVTSKNCWVGQARNESTRRIQRAISSFAEGKPLAKLFMAPDLIYPIPE